MTPPLPPPVSWALPPATLRAGKACVVISSELPELVGLSDRVLVMRGGRFVAELTGENITEQNIVYAAASSGNDTEGRKRA